MYKFNLKKFISKKNWFKNWSGHWSLLSCTIFGYEYTVLLKKKLKVGINDCLFIEKDGKSSAYYNEKALREFAGALAKKAQSNPAIIDLWCRDIKKQTDKVLDLIEKRKGGKIGLKEYKIFVEALDAYAAPHRALKMVIDYLPSELLKKKLKKMQAARLYAEPVYTVNEIFVEKWAKQVEQEKNVPYQLILCCTKDEVDNFWKTGKLPNKKILSERFKHCVILFERGKYQLITGKQVNKIEETVISSFVDDNQLKGACAYPGNITGKVRIVFDPKSVNKFNKGDILVAPMTRPEYLGLVKKSAGFITDAGGMLSHAAITARELKKPCVVGTQVATKILKNGDVVEINAEKGNVKIIR